MSYWETSLSLERRDHRLECHLPLNQILSLLLNNDNNDNYGMLHVCISLVHASIVLHDVYM